LKEGGCIFDCQIKPLETGLIRYAIRENIANCLVWMKRFDITEEEFEK